MVTKLSETRLSDKIEQIITLAEAISAYWDAELPKYHPDYPFVRPGEPTAPPPPEKRQLANLFESMDRDEVYKTIALMYIGRGDCDARNFPLFIHEMEGTFKTPEEAIRQMIGKSPLGEYLADGIEDLRKNGIDIDQAGPVAASPRA